MNPAANMLSKQSISSLKAIMALCKGNHSRPVFIRSLRKTIPSRSSGRLSRVTFGPKLVQASRKHPVQFIPECFKKVAATSPRRYQLLKTQARARRIAQVLAQAPPLPEIPQEAGSIIQDVIMSDAAEDEALAVDVDVDTKMEDAPPLLSLYQPLQTHSREHSVNSSGPPTPLNTTSWYTPHFQESHDDDRMSLDETPWYTPRDKGSYNDSSTRSNAVPWNTTRPEDTHDAILSPSDVAPWYAPRLQGTTYPHSQPPLPQAPKISQFLGFGERHTNPCWGKYAPLEVEPEQSQYEGSSLSLSTFAPAEQTRPTGKFALVFDEEDCEFDDTDDEDSDADVIPPNRRTNRRDQGDW